MSGCPGTCDLIARQTSPAAVIFCVDADGCCPYTMTATSRGFICATCSATEAGPTLSASASRILTA